MKTHTIIATVLLGATLTLAPSVHAWTCEEYAHSAARWARGRTDGIPPVAYILAVRQDVAAGRLHPDTAARIEDIITAVYAEPTVTPEAWHQRAYQACVAWARTQPPPRPQLQPARPVEKPTPAPAAEQPGSLTGLAPKPTMLPHGWRMNCLNNIDGKAGNLHCFVSKESLMITTELQVGQPGRPLRLSMGFVRDTCKK